MIGSATLALALLAVSQQAGDEAICGDAPNQSAMNRCAAQTFEAADAELNRVWRVVIAEARESDREMGETDGRPGSEAVLRDAQRAWITFRDAHCTWEGYAFRGGSMEPMIFSLCRTAVTRDRTGQLRAGAEDQ